ncbi:amidohydrolase [Halobacterium bonnevillei]|uniref:Amidohydrolase n=1 Tax=Halobacterium bonnevillei TaxID=2692200 RepID=A0A6B0SKS3_9EURY|nr:amidohydrolase [Halobacterium bonnevillei]MXR21106.1 amidohydrolase [Halobacterium bonnevillei]
MPDADRLTSLRRDLHRFPEPAWREFRTTCRLVDELEAVGVDDLHVGRDAMDPDERMAVPDDADLAEWFERARDADVDESVLSQLAGGYTGVVARLDCGDGPHVGLRVDIDGLLIEESTADDHTPERGGFRSEYAESMHACGHDGHMTIGVGVIEAVQASDFAGTLTVFFQPAEEASGGGKPMAESEHVEGIDYLFAVHLGLGHPTGEVVGGIRKPLAMCHVDATFHGESAHAGKAPNEGRNAIQALTTAVQNAYGIPRHADGMTRVNVGKIDGGTASNVIAERAHALAEARGETTELMAYARDELRRVFESAAEMHDCTVDFDVVSESPRADSDPDLAALVAETADRDERVDSVLQHADFGASEDATFLMEAVQAQGGLATYAIVGTDHPTAHHTPTFDVDERSLPIAVDVLASSIERVATDEP